MLLWRVDPLLGKDLEKNNERTTVATQRRGKQASTTLELLLETVFYNPSVQSGSKEDNWGDPVSCQFLVESRVLQERL
jgi:hypothetical protein